MKALILTKSAMKAHGVSGVCTTAYDLDSGKILRLVSNEYGGPIPNPYNSRYECLDIIDAVVIKECPIGPQQENVLVNLRSIENVCHPNIPLEIIYSLYRSTVKGELLYMNKTYSSLDSIEEYNHSIEILKVADLKIEKNEWGRTRASFKRADDSTQYKYYSVTDPKYMLERTELDRKDIGKAYIVVSVPYEPSKDRNGFDRFYKFIAAIYPID